MGTIASQVAIRHNLPSPLASLRRRGQWLRARYCMARTERRSHTRIRLDLDPNYQYRLPSQVYLAPSVWRRIG